MSYPSRIYLCHAIIVIIAISVIASIITHYKNTIRIVLNFSRIKRWIQVGLSLNEEEGSLYTSETEDAGE